jgi:hypothetical protein
LLIFSHVIAPKKQKAIKKNEKDECIWLDEGGILTSEEIQGKNSAWEAEHAEVKLAKQAAIESKAQNKLHCEEKKKETEEKKAANRELAQQKAQAKAEEKRL